MKPHSFCSANGKEGKMNSTRLRVRVLMFACAVAFVLTSSLVSFAQSSTRLPNPILMFLGQEPYQANGKSFIRYSYGVDNSSAYPDSLFAASPSLPPCGTNTKASRTWVDIFDLQGHRLYGFCALGKSKDLNGIWFALEDGVVPPSWIYIEMNDRQTQTKYKSNLADTTM